VEVEVEVEVDEYVCNELGFLVEDLVWVLDVCLCVEGDACVIFDELLESSPLPKSHEPCITPAVSDAKTSNSALDMSSAPKGQEGHSSTIVAPWVLPLAVMIICLKQSDPLPYWGLFSATIKSSPEFSFPQAPIPAW